MEAAPPEKPQELLLCFLARLSWRAHELTLCQDGEFVLPLLYSKLLLPWSKEEAWQEHVSEAHLLWVYSGEGGGNAAYASFFKFFFFWSTAIFENKSAQESQEVCYSPSITQSSRGP